MKAREVVDRIHWVGVVDWDRRVFDSLVPIPDGTSYNAYIVRGSDKTALIDTVEPGFADVLLSRIDSLGIETIDYVVCNHAEQDHSGALPHILARFPAARVLCTAKAAPMLEDLLGLDRDVMVTVKDGEVVSLGDVDLSFIHFPWVHWPETMLTYVPQRKALFPCDLFGGHLATNALVGDSAESLAAAKLYYAQIMMPFRKPIAKKLGRVEELEIDYLCPSHGPVHAEPASLVAAYKLWVGGEVANRVVIPFISMHESTRLMIDGLIDSLSDRGIAVSRFDLEDLDVGRFATALVDAATIVFGTPTVLGGPHPNVMHAAYLTGLLRPKATSCAVVGSFGWGGKSVEQIQSALAALKLEFLAPVLWKGRPDSDCLSALDELAGAIADRHAAVGAV